MKNLEPENPTLKSWDEIYKGLTAPFPAEALSTDNSRGFALTSIKAQYLVERLNEAVGVGNWRHIGTYEKLEGHDDILFMGKLVIWSKEGANEQLGVGSSNSKKLGDAYKGAKTDSLSKCGSLFGLGNAVFKGLVTPPGGKSSSKSSGKLSKVEDF